MIHLVGFTVSPVTNIVFTWNLFCYIWKSENGQHYMNCENNDHYYEQWLWVGRVNQLTWESVELLLPTPGKLTEVSQPRPLQKSKMALANLMGASSRTLPTSSILSRLDFVWKTTETRQVSSMLFCFVRSEKWGRTDGRTDNTYENNDDYRPWLWVGRVDQYSFTLSMWACMCSAAATCEVLEPTRSRASHFKFLANCMVISFRLA